MMTRVLLADDQPLIRAGLTMVIADAPDLEVVAEASSGAEAVRLAAEAHADVVVMDIRMPGTDGITATRAITAGSATRVIVLITFDDDENVYASLRAGASGFLVKDIAELFISAATVKTHLASLLLKLGARDRIQLVVMAHEAGLV